MTSLVELWHRKPVPLEKSCYGFVICPDFLYRLYLIRSLFFCKHLKLKQNFYCKLQSVASTYVAIVWLECLVKIKYSVTSKMRVLYVPR